MERNPKKRKALNRIRVVLAEQERSNLWLAKQLKKSPVTISAWCNNRSQPSLETLVDIARVLDVNICELLHDTKEK